MNASTTPRAAGLNSLCVALRLVLGGLCLAPVACEDADDDAGSDLDGSDASAGAQSSAGRCYYEYRASYSCSDGDGDTGVWEATCSDITQDACGGHSDFAGSSDYVDGCLFVTEFRAIEWLDADACEDRLPDPTGANSTPDTSGEPEPAPDPYGACFDGTCADPEADWCMSDGSSTACARSCVTPGSGTECPASAAGTPSVCAFDADGNAMCVLDCTWSACPSGMTCNDVSGDGSFSICLW